MVNLTDVYWSHIYSYFINFLPAIPPMLKKCLINTLAKENCLLTKNCDCSPAVEEVYLAPEYICHFLLDSLSTDSSDFKSAG